MANLTDTRTICISVTGVEIITLDSLVVVLMSLASKLEDRTAARDLLARAKMLDDVTKRLKAA